MRARVDHEARVRWLTEDDEVTEDRASLVNDQNGWLFFTCLDATPGEPAARLLPMHRVVSVDFYGVTIEHDDKAIFERDIEVMDEAVPQDEEAEVELVAVSS